MDQQAKQLPFRHGHESIKDVGILAHDQVREQLHLLARLGELFIRGQRNERFVADAIDVDDDLSGEGFDEFALEEGDHRQAPSTKLQAPGKHQEPNRKPCPGTAGSMPRFGAWSLELPLSLDLGTWIFCRFIFSWAR